MLCLYHTFGCKLNFAETSTIAEMLEARGIQRCGDGEIPDIILINSCSVTAEADKKCRQTIRSFHRRYPDAAIVVTGCYAQLKGDEVSALPGVVIVAGTDRKNQVPDYIDQWIADKNAQCLITPLQKMTRFNPSCSRGDRTRYFLKVQDGCDYWCTYCTIPRARGRSRSSSIAEIVSQARDVASRGGKEIVITGVNIGDFGKGSDEKFIDLCRSLDEVEGIARYRISSIEPNLLTDEIIEFVANSKRFMPHFHIPLQCGSDEVLRLMRRHYDTALFRHKIERIRAVMPHAFIGVDLIVGARGETAEEFERSYSFVESLDISCLHVFPYSERPDTKALDISHVVSQEDKHKRAARMLALSEKKLSAFREQFIGTTREVLLEHSAEGMPMGGFTDNYIKVSVEASECMDNQIVSVALDGVVDGSEAVKGFIVKE
ncbi:MAG: tRNA (N(6)-L-threonylcarbamoyladenosine(37)-C(2))-methylthiotransferase MtaB [Muribaculaceae bacterium]|nr:tRNA (N(6)-L-threonylcarbamoyladenosine(37)-C(2))-methylthiotransferase MtaB [Muribaculaceae bacterium]